MTAVEGQRNFDNPSPHENQLLRLAEIDRMLPSRLSFLERSELEYERWELHRLLYPMSLKQDYLRIREQQVHRGSRTLERWFDVVEHIPQDIRDAIRRHPISDSGKQLDELSRLAPNRQQRLARLVGIDVDHRFENVHDLLASVTDAGEIVDTLPSPPPKPPRRQDQIHDILIETVAGRYTLERCFREIVRVYDREAWITNSANLYTPQANHDEPFPAVPYIRSRVFGHGTGPTSAANVERVKQAIRERFPKGGLPTIEVATRLWFVAGSDLSLITATLDEMVKNRQTFGVLNRPQKNVAVSVIKRIEKSRQEGRG